MVKIYGESGASFSSMAAYVSLEDYESLKAALREALDQWDSWNHSELEGTRGWLGEGKEHDERIRKLRAQFLDDK